MNGMKPWMNLTPSSGLRPTHLSRSGRPAGPSADASARRPHHLVGEEVSGSAGVSPAAIGVPPVASSEANGETPFGATGAEVLLPLVAVPRPSDGRGRAAFSLPSSS